MALTLTLTPFLSGWQVWQRIMEVPALMEAMMKPARLKMPARLETSADPSLLVPALCAKPDPNHDPEPTFS